VICNIVILLRCFTRFVAFNSDLFKGYQCADTNSSDNAILLVTADLTCYVYDQGRVAVLANS